MVLDNLNANQAREAYCANALCALPLWTETLAFANVTFVIDFDAFCLSLG
jgi:hypothetical protein